MGDSEIKFKAIVPIAKRRIEVKSGDKRMELDDSFHRSQIFSNPPDATYRDMSSAISSLKYEESMKPALIFLVDLSLIKSQLISALSAQDSTEICQSIINAIHICQSDDNLELFLTACADMLLESDQFRFASGESGLIIEISSLCPASLVAMELQSFALSNFLISKAESHVESAVFSKLSELFKSPIDSVSAEATRGFVNALAWSGGILSLFQRNSMVDRCCQCMTAPLKKLRALSSQLLLSFLSCYPQCMDARILEFPFKCISCDKGKATPCCLSIYKLFLSKSEYTTEALRFISSVDLGSVIKAQSFSSKCSYAEFLRWASSYLPSDDFSKLLSQSTNEIVQDINCS